MYLTILVLLGILTQIHTQLIQTESFFNCTGDPELPRFSSVVCPDSDAYTRVTLAASLGDQIRAEIQFVGPDYNRTRTEDQSGACLAPHCVVVPYTAIEVAVRSMRAQWSLQPIGLSLPWSYVLGSSNTTGDPARCTQDAMPEQFCTPDSNCSFPDVNFTTECSVNISDCDGAGLIPPPLTDDSGICGTGVPLCYEYCCVNTDINGTLINATSYQVTATSPQCRVYQAVGPPHLNSHLVLRVVNDEGFDEEFSISGGIGDLLQGTYFNVSINETQLRGYIRQTIANPSILEIPNVVVNGYFVFCDLEDGEVFGPGLSTDSTGSCVPSPAPNVSQWFYIHPSKVSVYGVGSTQYGQDAFGVIQDLALAGCNGSAIFPELIPGRIPNTNVFDVTSSFYNPSPCTILSMIQNEDPRSVYWLPPLFGEDGIAWMVQEGIVSVTVLIPDDLIIDNAFQLDVDVPTSVMAYQEVISPGYVDLDTSACFGGPDAIQPEDIIPGLLSPIICNPPVEDPSASMNQTYIVRYKCDPRLHLDFKFTTVTLDNGDCTPVQVEFNVSREALNFVDRVCYVTLSPAGDGTDPVSTPIPCFLGYNINPAPPPCSVWSFTCNFTDDGGHWYRSVPFWILLVASLVLTGLLIWYAITTSQMNQAKSARRKALIHPDLK